MKKNNLCFDAEKAIKRVKQYLPAQAALKDFVYYNTLEAYQNIPFHEALWEASALFGYRTYLSIDEFRSLYLKGQIKKEILEHIIAQHLLEKDEQKITQETLNSWLQKMLKENYDIPISSRIFQLSNLWKEQYKINLSKIVYPILFRILAAYLDQGISDWKFPSVQNNFLSSLRALEKNDFVSIFKTKRAKKILLNEEKTLSDLLQIVVGDESYFEHYIFDQQFGHPGWSGLVSVVENQPETLFDSRRISLEELIYFELLLEIDALDSKFGEVWKPLLIGNNKIAIHNLFEPVPESELKTILKLWQDAFEWSYFDGVLAGIQQTYDSTQEPKQASFQGLFCIDDRMYSFRRHIESVDSMVETFGTPGYFGVEFYFQPEDGKFVTRACPANVEPKFLIKEVNRKKKIQKDAHLQKGTHTLLWGGLISGTLGFWSAIKLFFNIFKPSLSSLTVHSFEHADKYADLLIDASGETENGLNIGFTPSEMADRVANVLKSIGLSKDFAPIVYVVGHGGSSVNNPYYTAYDCGACAGRPGAVNARVLAYMANKKEVRDLLINKGLAIPASTYFVGAMHDTTRDEIEFYDEETLPEGLQAQHQKNIETFLKALTLNARERSFRYESVNSYAAPNFIHKKMKERSVSLFEPRVEWDHTDNALCIIGRKALYQNLYLDKRPFINSYDYAQDGDGNLLYSILSAAIPVCGGINLSYYFSKVDQQKLGAGTKLPHNIVGLFGINTGVDGDLRTGLPSQMIEIHDPVRILFIIEHYPQVIQNVLNLNDKLKEWVENEWVLFSAIHPDTKQVYRFKNKAFEEYEPLTKTIKEMETEKDLLSVISKETPTLLMN